jgi:cytochrome oxidase Cu insertion factor (SCO1/SenC/PrrC family)
MKTSKLPVLALATCASLFFARSLLAQQPFSQTSNPPSTTVELSVPDIQVVNQFGEHVRFNSDVVNGRVAVITSFLTNCSAYCPITQEKLAQLAKVLGDKMGREVAFISVSVDPENDTPEHMKAWGEKSGWSRVSSWSTAEKLARIVDEHAVKQPGAATVSASR